MPISLRAGTTKPRMARFRSIHGPSPSPVRFSIENGAWYWPIMTLSHDVARTLTHTSWGDTTGLAVCTAAHRAVVAVGAVSALAAYCSALPLALVIVWP